MEVKVLLFGPAAIAAGRREVPVRLDGPSTCAAVGRALATAEPKVAAFVPNGRLAVNHAFAGPEHVVREGDEVALIAMVSGG